MSTPQISAIICTHNRDSYLGAAIDSLMAQEFSEEFEIIVVDNASSDNTRSVVEQRLSQPNLHYIYEAIVGLSVARNTGANVAKAPILAYLDDDAEASPQWLQSLHTLYQDHAKVAIAGGKVTLRWPPSVPRPNWVSDNLAGTLGLYDLGPHVQFIETPGQTPRGLNYSLRRSFLEHIGGFDLNLGRVGTRLLSNEELHMTQRALESHWQVAYVPDALVAHNVAPERIHPAWFLKRSWWQGISEYYREQLVGQDSWAQFSRGGERCVRGLYNALKYINHPAKRFDNLVYTYGQLGYLKSALQGLLIRLKFISNSPEFNPE